MRQFFYYGDRLRLVWRLLAGLLIIGGCVLLATIPIAILDPLLADSDWLAAAVGVTVGTGVTGGVWLASRRLDKREPVFRWDWRLFAVGLAVGTASIALIVLLEWAVGWVQFEGTFYTSGRSFIATILSITVIYLSVGFYEELLTRRYLLANFHEAYGTLAAVILSSLGFAALHAGNLNVSVLGMLNLVLLGVVLAVMTVRGGSIAAAVGMHITWNITQELVFGLPVSGGTPEAALIDMAQTGPTLLTGGAFGPEGGLLVTAALIGIGVIWWMYQPQEAPDEAPTASEQPI